MIPGSTNQLLTAQRGYRVSNSLRFRSSASAYLNRTPGTAGNRKTWTWSGWVKRGALGAAQGIIKAGPSSYVYVFFDSNDTLYYQINTGSVTGTKITTAVYRDPSAWYHIVVQCDTTQATALNRMRLYVNGVEVTAWSTNTVSFAQNYDTDINNTVAHYLMTNSAANQYCDGYLAEINFIDGQALDATSFGQTDTSTGVWMPKAYAGTYGANGFYLQFSDVGATSGSNTGYGKDFAGTNYWTTNNLSSTTGVTYDSMVDTPTNYDNGGNGAGNYCVLNPIDRLTTATLEAANLQFTSATTGHNAIGSIGMSDGKWYWEAQTSAGTTQARATVYGTSAAAYYSFAANNTVYGFRFDASAGTLEQTADGTSWTSVATGLTSGPYFPYFNNNGTTSKTITVNFGQRPFTYTPPTGFKALNTQNLTTPTIINGAQYMDATLYTGSASTQSVTNSGSMQPDLVWIKDRTSAQDNKLTDAVRGTTKGLISNTTGDETTDSNGVTAFNANGFSLGTGTRAYSDSNADSYVAWQWKESATSGFDIVTYTGNGSARTISHSLNAVPNMIIVKARTTASTDQGWPVYHSANTSAPETDYLMLNTTAATADLDTVWNDTAPTSSVFSVGTNANVNANNDTYVAYLWCAIAGYSAFGSYTGNGSTDGPFVYLGFRPKYILTKRTDSTGNWEIYDTARDSYNVMSADLSAESSAAEASTARFDALSNGFKVRTTGAATNASGGTYIYAAFAENPFKISRAR